MATQLSESAAQNGFSVKLWRGERMVLIGMDVDEPEADFVGFSIEVQGPQGNAFVPLRNRLNFAYSNAPGSKTVDGYRNFDSTQAPFQKFRWIHFPEDPKDGVYLYRVIKQHMHDDGTLYAGTSLTVAVKLQNVIYDGFLDVGFTRNYASSQAYADKFGNNANIIPADITQGLSFKKVSGDVYQWLGFEAYQLLFNLLDEIVADQTLTLDLFVYDFNEPDILSRLEQMGSRLRAIIDDSKDHKDGSAESLAAARLADSAGSGNVHRMHFSTLQHNKTLIVKKNGQPYKVLFGSTNFSFRGLYIQANNALVFQSPPVVALFAQYFQQAFSAPSGFAKLPFAGQWHPVNVPGKPRVSLCFSPHSDASLSLGEIGKAISAASSSVFFCIAFLNQATSGAVREAVDALEGKPLFSYGISDKAGGLAVHKPDGSLGIVDFEYLAQHAPEPFKTEWSGGQGIHQHDKFVVVDFNLPTAKVFTGSCNMSVSGEEHNGDNLICIEDPQVATSFAIEAIRIFDHLEFRTKMKSSGAPRTLTLAKPSSLSGKPAWFTRFYVADSQAERDRKLFGH